MTDGSPNWELRERLVRNEVESRLSMTIARLVELEDEWTIEAIQDAESEATSVALGNCKTCKGSGEITMFDGDDEYLEDCPTCEAIRDDGPGEIYEYWAVSSWLASKLAERGAIVLDMPDGKVWGRQTTGQAITLDGIIADIAAELAADSDGES